MTDYHPATAAGSARRAARSGGRGRPSRGRGAAAGSTGMAYWLLASLWILTLFDPQWNLAARGISVFLKLPVFLFVALGATLAISGLTSKSFGQRWTWYAPLLTYIAVAIASGVTAPNLFLARDEIQVFLLYWTMVVGTVALVDTPKKAELLLTAFGVQFTWWALWGAQTGGVGWHPVLANYDGFGAYMVIAMGMCSFLALASDGKWFRRLMFATVAIALVGMVASFARGAFLAGMLVAGAVWLRSPRKGMTLLAGIGGLVVVMIAASLLFGDAYWEEMSTIFAGTEEETGEDRWVMWTAGFKVFLHEPILGAGPNNWGARATEIFRPGDLGGQYTYNVGALYGRQLHSSYVTVLAELGIVGTIVFIWILVDFWRRNGTLRTPQAERVWRSLGGRLKLRYVALGLEAAMVGWLGAAALYSLAGTHWLYTILALNLLLHSLVTGKGSRDARSGPAIMPRRSVRRSAPVAGAVTRASVARGVARPP